jgi:hypothetical protein
VGTWHVDHDHKSGVVRGLLCWVCNSRLGVIENRDWMAEAERYLFVFRKGRS